MQLFGGKLDSMIPWLGSRQFVKRVLRKHGVEVTKVWWDVLFVIRRLGVLSEALYELLGNCSSCVNMLCLGKSPVTQIWLPFSSSWKISSPDWEIVQCQFGFIFLIGIFYESWEGVSPAGTYSFNVFPLGIPLHFAVGLAAYAAAQKASGHFDGPGAEVDFWIMLVQPGEPEYHALLAEVGDCKQDAFRMSVVGHDHVNNFMDASSLRVPSIL